MDFILLKGKHEEDEEKVGLNASINFCMVKNEILAVLDDNCN